MQLTQVLYLISHVSHEAEPIPPYPAHVLHLFNTTPFLWGFIIGSIIIISQKGFMNQSYQGVLFSYLIQLLSQISCLLRLLFHQFPCHLHQFFQLRSQESLDQYVLGKFAGGGSIAHFFTNFPKRRN